MNVIGNASVLERPVQCAEQPSVSREAKVGKALHGWVPQFLLIAAAALIGASLLFSFWGMNLRAPQYPGGLKARIYITHLAGDIQELNGLNHYIGMMNLNQAAALERSLAVYLIPTFALLTLAAAFVRLRWWWLLAIPALGLPVVFIADLGAWLYYAGHALDPRAPLSSSIKPFTPPVLGEGKIGQFTVVAFFETGFYLVLAASSLIVAAIALRWRAAASRRAG
ncbi:MAG: cytochrome C [Dehalococcoidia bacterium]|nr:cytochrome C [Dehalococcoidia bacterium]